MSIGATGLVLLSAALHVGWNAVAKSSREPVLFLGVKGLWLLGLGLVFLAAMPLQAIPAGVWYMAAWSGLIHAFYALALGRAYRGGDISYVYPIARSAPALIPVFAYFTLDERVGWLGGLGIAAVVLGVVWMQVVGLEGGAGRIVRALAGTQGRWAVATLLATTGYSLVDKVGMQAFSAADEIDTALRGPLYFILENTIAYAFYLGALLARSRRELIALARAEWGRAFWAGVATLASYSLILHVLQTESLSYVVAVRQASVLIAPLVGWALLEEPHGRARLAPAALIAGGVAVVALYG